MSRRPGGLKALSFECGCLAFDPRKTHVLANVATTESGFETPSRKPRPIDIGRIVEGMNSRS